MDLDAYARARQDEWDDLARLGRKRRLEGADADRLIERYQAGAADLSTIRTSAGQSVHGDRLSLALSRARLRFTGARANVLQQLPRFFVAQLPAALYRLRWLSLAVTIATAIVALLWGYWAYNDPAVLATFGDEEYRRQFVEEDFVAYYSENPPSSFTGQVWTNNAWLAAQCIAFGVLGVFVPYLLYNNALNIGMSGGLMFAYDRGDIFFLYILPHGQLELYAIFVAGAAGLRIFWSWIAPGPRSRLESLGAEARAIFTVVVGLILALLVSGVIEGFVTGSTLPFWIKIPIGTVALGAFLYYQWAVGRKAYRAGQTGDLDEFEAGARRLTAG
jgi:uncharacterized membrane protein SpoIIM required for sporulation